MKTIKRILVPTDLSEYSFSALDYALELAKIYDAKINLLYVLDKNVFINLYLSSERIFEDIEADAREEMKKKLNPYKNADIISTNINWGYPYKEIVDFAEENEMDIIIMSTHTKPGLAHFFLGSVTEKVIRYSEIPVLIVRPEKVKNNLMKSNVEESVLA